MNYFECVKKNIKAHLPRSKWEKAKSFLEEFLEKKSLESHFFPQEMKELLLKNPCERDFLAFLEHSELIKKSIDECELTPDSVTHLTASRDMALKQFPLTSPEVLESIMVWLNDKNMNVSSVTSQLQLYDSFVNSLIQEHQLGGNGKYPDNLFACYSWGDDSIYWLNKGGSHRFAFIKLWGPKLNKNFTIKARLLHYSLDRAKVLEFTKNDQFYLTPALTFNEWSVLESELKKLFPKYDFSLGVDKLAFVPNSQFPPNIQIRDKTYRIIKLPYSRIDDHLQALKWFNLSNFLLVHCCESNENQPQ